ncbi:MAG: NAD-dependent epimerase/dehydratase family protein [Candidatus Marinimicrobia bacterium]|jgi:nucleoside-diphosphate-sugar epimerase|nr:NAD-dependent epimerase/dehydratase family protein [Candidatus Neomarinimicrobiota bacterium]MBT3576887.1 NAD-dependent epimerase/dehydratase family protein [Candidatus Neomarinimicrobiota bacterium]MBT3680212.1 NAD-dependent epimerase/dehydratase family protein [Candidatus Neomarinimicrobiota bacterium]MBT3951928.1 NAD-dependent epimerase/dehydratase family protein [Candidatus Neomarinimicrobiota bacterium]MBT4251809.1 NAD-dependent epimerase/dehydratase family protein [Candidatus Neomarini
MKVLFIGGTGIISSACSELAVSRGIDLYHLNRGTSAELRPVSGVKTIKADIRNSDETLTALGDHQFDVVVNWITFTTEQLQHDIDIFSSRTKQYVFISTAALYETPPSRLPITEETPLSNPYWEYARKKIAVEESLREAYLETGFPYTIVRPSHTYDKTLIPLQGGITTLMRIKQGLPVISHGDGASVWTLTHHKDFAKGLVGLLGKAEAINEAYHITSDEWLSWDNIFRHMGSAMGIEPNLVHIPSDIIARYDQVFAEGLLGDKSHSMIFDNSKIKTLVPDFSAEIPFEQGAKEIVAWYEADSARQKIDPYLNGLFDKMIQYHASKG